MLRPPSPATSAWAIFFGSIFPNRWALNLGWFPLASAAAASSSSGFSVCVSVDTARDKVRALAHLFFYQCSVVAMCCALDIFFVLKKKNKYGSNSYFYLAARWRLWVPKDMGTDESVVSDFIFRTFSTAFCRWSFSTFPDLKTDSEDKRFRISSAVSLWRPFVFCGFTLMFTMQNRATNTHPRTFHLFFLFLFVTATLFPVLKK